MPFEENAPSLEDFLHIYAVISKQYNSEPKSLELLGLAVGDLCRRVKRPLVSITALAAGERQLTLPSLCVETGTATRVERVYAALQDNVYRVRMLDFRCDEVRLTRQTTAEAAFECAGLGEVLFKLKVKYGRGKRSA